MKTCEKAIVLVFIAALTGCKLHVPKNGALATPNNKIFEEGSRITNANFIGTAYLLPLIAADSLNTTNVGSVTFEPTARTKWHVHPAGQIVIAIEGEGYYQEKGQPKKFLRPGDAVKCPPNLPHWHGAGPHSRFVQLAITSYHKGETKWLETVPDSVYYAK